MPCIDSSHLLYMPMRIPHNKNKLSRDKSISCLMIALAFSYVHETQRYNVCFYNWWNHSFWPLQEEGGIKKVKSILFIIKSHWI